MTGISFYKEWFVAPVILLVVITPSGASKLFCPLSIYPNVTCLFPSAASISHSPEGTLTLSLSDCLTLGWEVPAPAWCCCCGPSSWPWCSCCAGSLPDSERAPSAPSPAARCPTGSACAPACCGCCRSGSWEAGWEEMVRSRWFLFLRKSLLAPKPKLPLRSTMRAVLDLAGRERWLYSSWDKWAA